ncbi:MAG: helix-turn-helix transcriptional regulator, partial [Anaerolineales bacterium]
FVSALNRLQSLEPEIGVGALQMLQSPQPPPPETILISVINELALATQKIVLVLDDYHLIDNQTIHDSLSYLSENLPPQLHLVITTREDPPIQISRLRSRSHLTELRAVDLRFKSSEAAEFLNQVMGLNLSAADIAALEVRTEGWITGLQMAAISMQGSRDVAGFIESFTGSHRYVLDYLIEEVLEQQHEEIQTFLLQTAILERLNGSLCDAVTGQENGQETLEMLDRANLFIIPLDDERHWYRYHHLFRDLLRQRLRQTKLDQEILLHHKASVWYQKNGFPDQAIAHAFQAEEFDRAVHLIEEQADACWRRGEHAKLRHWLNTLPTESLRSNPNLCVFQAWELFTSGQLDASEKSLQAVEKTVRMVPNEAAETLATAQDPLNESYRMKIQGRVSNIRAWIAFREGDTEAIFLHSRQALEYLSKDDLSWRNSAAVALGSAYFLGGDLRVAAQLRMEAWETSKQIGNIYMNLLASMKLAINLRQRGKLERVTEICHQQWQLAKKSGLSHTAEAGWILAIWGEALAEQGNLEEANYKTQKGSKLTEGGDMAVIDWGNLCLTRVLFSSGDIAGAEAIIKKMDDLAKNRVVPPWITTQRTAWQVRLWLVQDKLEQASQWVSERGLSVSGDPHNIQDMDHIALARTLIAKGQPADTFDLLERIHKATEGSGYTSKKIETLNLQALAFQAWGDTTRAMIPLKQALAQAEPGGFLRIFVDEGPAMARLLYEALSREIAPEYVQKLLAAFPNVEPGKDVISQPIV